MNNEVLFLSHGAGPLPLMQDSAHTELIALLEALPNQLSTPKLIIVISAHWESEWIEITAHPNPKLIYDYSGFPAEAYELTYPCPGAPREAKLIEAHLKQLDFPVKLHSERGLDHGAFVPLKLLYPDADIPVIQISLQSNLDAEFHIRLGEALAKIELSDVLYLGSGFSYHNMGGFRSDSAEVREANSDFDEWLDETMTGKCTSTELLRTRLVGWATAPGARHCHPREEHLIPLHVCFGIAGREASQNMRISVMNKRTSNFVWS